jgi:phasin protein
VNNPRSERPAKSRRPARRSMADLLAVLESDNGGAQLPLTLSVATAADVPAATPAGPADTPAKPARKHARATGAKASEAPSETPAVALDAEPRVNGSSSAPEQSRTLAADIALAAVTVAPPADTNGAAADPHGKRNNGHAPAPAPMLPAPHRAADELRAKALEIVNANVNATLDYARELAQVKSPAAFIALSTSHAQRRFELMMTHAAALGALSHPFAARRPNE